jgi:hypothetical protein
MRSDKLPRIPPSARPNTIDQPLEVNFGAKYAMAATTKQANIEKRTVAPSARLKAAPEFLISVNWRNEPILFTGFRESKLASAQLLVAKSVSQIAQAIK